MKIRDKLDKKIAKMTYLVFLFFILFFITLIFGSKQENLIISIISCLLIAFFFLSATFCSLYIWFGVRCPKCGMPIRNNYYADKWPKLSGLIKYCPHCGVNIDTEI